jgi:hypothetical protein
MVISQICTSTDAEKYATVPESVKFGLTNLVLGIVLGGPAKRSGRENIGRARQRTRRAIEICDGFAYGKDQLTRQLLERRSRGNKRTFR